MCAEANSRSGAELAAAGFSALVFPLWLHGIHVDAGYDWTRQKEGSSAHGSTGVHL